MIEGEVRKPLKIGMVTTVDAETGEVVETRRNAGMLLPPAADKCQVCATAHAWDQPHNQQSMYYQMAFYATHSQWPTWSDAMAHCTTEVQARWRQALIEKFRSFGLKVPEDLMQPIPAGR